MTRRVLASDLALDTRVAHRHLGIPDAALRTLWAALAAASALLLVLPFAAFAQTGTTIDTFQLAPGKSAVGRSIVADAAGGLYCVGSGADAAGVARWLVRKSMDAGATWSIVDEFNLVAGKISFATRVTISDDGILYVVGGGSDGTVSRWLVRRSTDGGATWETVDNFFYVPANTSTTTARSIATDHNGNVYVAGEAFVGTVGYSWIVRRSTPGGQSWQTVDAFRYPVKNALKNASAYAVVADAANNIYVSGSETSTGDQRWLVRKSTNGGTSFVTLTGSAFQQERRWASSAEAMAVDASTGTLYVSGIGWSSNGCHWIVRKSTNGGVSFTTIDDFQYVRGFNSSARAIDVLSDGRVVVSGWGTPDYGNYTVQHFILRMSPRGGTGFSTFDDYVTPGSLYNAQVGNIAHGVAEVHGFLFAAGYGTDSMDATGKTPTWLIRRY